ncbi:MAG: diaminopimelate decarboxylase [Bacteroidetes bacterium GWF2_49_14]|nr:MAG: diaminopimelate decarboxylase [Bacteroidetes bacterium GWF2_49_14]HBB91381.1 diaminopimelate decarboxylase [Bacteroidales bacterium]
MNKKAFEPPVIKRMTSTVPGKFGSKSQVEPISSIDGVPVADLLEKFGSPLFILSEKTIRRVHQDASEAFKSRYPKVQLAWSYKTNYLDAVCRIYHQEGSWAEVVSGFEYEKALHNGVDGKRIIFNGPDKSENDLRRAIDLDSYIHIDHFDELFTLIRLAREIGKRSRVAIRVNMDTGIYPKWDRFGFNFENGEAAQAIDLIMESGALEMAGLHTHIGTYIISLGAYRIAAEKLARLAIDTDRKYQHKIKYIDMGGGFASMNTLKGAYHTASDTTPSFDQYAEAIAGALQKAGFDQGHLPVLILETGRALIDEAGYLAGQVLATKRLSDSRRALILDFGVNLLFTAFWYDHVLHPVEEVSGFLDEATLYGPLCMNIDVLREQTQMPLFRKGDKVVISKVGAYNMTQWMQFITYRPNVIMIAEDNSVHIIRRAETLETILGQESLPEHLKP